MKKLMVRTLCCVTAMTDMVTVSIRSSRLPGVIPGQHHATDYRPSDGGRLEERASCVPQHEPGVEQRDEPDTGKRAGVERT